MTPTTGNKVELEFSLHDNHNEPIVPFLLTVERGDGKVLLRRKRIPGRAYVVKDVEVADYIFVLESVNGRFESRMGWTVA